MYGSFGWSGESSHMGVEINIDDEGEGITPLKHIFQLAGKLSLPNEEPQFQETNLVAIAGNAYYPDMKRGNPRNFVLAFPFDESSKSFSRNIIQLPLNQVRQRPTCTLTLALALALALALTDPRARPHQPSTAPSTSSGV